MVEGELFRRWKDLKEEEKLPYAKMMEEDRVWFKKVMEMEEEKKKMVEGRLKGGSKWREEGSKLGALNGVNRPALFFYLIEKLDALMLKDPCPCFLRVLAIDQESVPLATALYHEWKSMKKEEKEKYEEIRRKYGMTETGEMVLPRLRSYARWFSLVHHRYFLLQRPSFVFWGVIRSSLE